jgi:hypothetical protein
MDVLIACPFCDHTDRLRVIENVQSGWGVYCLNCGINGKHSEDRDFAILFWNTRPREEAKDARIAVLEGVDLEAMIIRQHAKIKEQKSEIIRLNEALKEIYRLPLAPETSPDRPYSLLANISHLAKTAMRIENVSQTDD